MPLPSALPDAYREMNEDELGRRIAAVRARLGPSLAILGHYYQQGEVVSFADFEGDSFALAKAGAEMGAHWILFCGVHFMAESSVILARSGQRVFLPDLEAGCPLAEMASIEEVEDAWECLERAGVAGEFLPVAYMNSSAALKAFCGRRGGLVCTSSSAGRAFDWVRAQRRRVFFFPDENLGRNTARDLGIAEEDVLTFDPKAPEGGLGPAALARARVLVWKGHCHVHTLFTRQQVEEARAGYPGCKVAVHPECSPEVVLASDASGSTAFLKKYAEEALAGATVVIGTEINLVARLSRAMPDKKILPLTRSLCPNMFKISLTDLCWTLEHLGEVNEVLVPPDIARDAKVALERMLAL